MSAAARDRIDGSACGGAVGVGGGTLPGCGGSWADSAMGAASAMAKKVALKRRIKLAEAPRLTLW